MAKSTLGGVGKRRLPKLASKKGKPLPQSEVDKNIDNWVESEFQEELRLTAYLDFNLRRQIRIATGVGDMDTFIELFNNKFKDAMTAATPEIEKQIKASSTRKPKLKKLNQEYTVAYRPPKK